MKTKREEKKEENLRKKIKEYWDETGAKTRGNTKRNEFLMYLADEGMARNTAYYHLNKGCRQLSGYKLKGLSVCVEEYKETKRKKASTLSGATNEQQIIL